MVEKLTRLAAGVDLVKADKLTDQLNVLLSTAHAVTDEDFRLQRPKLEESARQLLGDMDALQVMRNAMEFALAELLSNPRLAAALDARFKTNK